MAKKPTSPSSTKPAKTKPVDRCKEKARVTKQTIGTGGGQKTILDVHSCCRETRNVITKGFKQLSSGGKAHLQALSDELATQSLEEYCFMVWGLDEKELVATREVVYNRLALRDPAK